ncbi:GNAT family N-acetyltransferase [Paeniglutamicibacter sp. R2-26]|uniref:GNAT family N-acetyltransferase n=1 Tax=Paeniglutamicibacter sp. R2-26 TaxID=3144417 RepID=UPI003EE4EE0E
MGILLQTTRLVMREFTENDADLLVALDSDPAVMHYISNGIPTSRAEVVAEQLPAFLAYHRESKHLGFWAAHRRATQEFLGWFHLRPEPGRPETEPELGYRLRRACWGEGLATEGSRALIDHTFENTPATRITASTMAVHLASRRVMEKAGMGLARHFDAEWPVHIEGDEHGDVEYEITRQTWQEQLSRTSGTGLWPLAGSGPFAQE